MKAIIDGLIVLPNEIINGHVIMYEKDIWRIVPRKQFRAGMCSEFIDANGGFVVPGFINEHIHGCAGADTMDDDDQALKTMQQALPATGVTSFVPTTMTMEQGRIEKASAGSARPGTTIRAAPRYWALIWKGLSSARLTKAPRRKKISRLPIFPGSNHMPTSSRSLPWHRKH